MIHYVLYSADGSIVGSGSCQDGASPPANGNLSALIVANREAASVSPARYMVSNGEVVPRPTGEVESLELAEAWRQVRAQRDALLAQTDWIVAKSVEAGAPVPQAWATYRQALRDVTQQTLPVTWPTAPTSN